MKYTAGSSGRTAGIGNAVFFLWMGRRDDREKAWRPAAAAAGRGAAAHRSD